MSADNGIYILKTADGQYRVTHAQAIENIYENYNSSRYDPMEVIRIWKNCRYTRNKLKAYEVAEAMERRWGGTEYGIRTFEYRKPWKYIIEDAKSKADSVKQRLIEESKIRELNFCDKYDLKVIEEILNM